jgi:hypothetical protein
MAFIRSIASLRTAGWPNRRYSLHNRQRSPTSTMDAQKPLVLTRA